MIFRIATTFVGTLVLLGATPLVAAPVSPDAVLVVLDIQHNGETVFAPRLLVQLNRMSEASMQSSDESHRVVLAVTEQQDRYLFKSLYLTKEGDGRWVVQAEPQMIFGGHEPAAMTLADEAGQLQFEVIVTVGGLADMLTQHPDVAAVEAGDRGKRDGLIRTLYN